MDRKYFILNKDTYGYYSLEEIFSLYKNMILTYSNKAYYHYDKKIEIDDIFQACSMCLMKAYYDYDIEKYHVGFSHYFKRCLVNKLIKIGVSEFKTYRKGYDKNINVVSLNEIIGGEDLSGNELEYFIPDKHSDDFEEDVINKIIISHAIEKKLNDHQKEILHLWMEGNNYSEIANHFDCTYTNIGNIVTTCLGKISKEITDRSISEVELMDECRINGCKSEGISKISKKYGIPECAIKYDIMHYEIADKLSGKIKEKRRRKNIQNINKRRQNAELCG